MIKISFGNKKLPSDTMIFNIPARVTCPGRTEFCAVSCYALKAERLYKAVLPARQSNFEASRLPTFAADMVERVNGVKHKIKRIRVHESGDFYNQAYLDAWYIVARAFPGIRFYAYTKSFHLNFSACPDNFWLIASFDSTTTPAAMANYALRREYFKNSFTIVDRHAPATCVQDCSACNKCWTGRGRNLTVNQH